MKRIVTIGGGNGQSELLTYLKEHDVEITAVVTMMDSGGSSGKLREMNGVLPPGDLRRCIAALAENTGAVCEWNERDREGHAKGNLEIVSEFEKVGAVTSAVRALSDRCGVKGTVLPVTEQLTHLVAEYDDGKTVVREEENIDVPKHDSSLHIDKLRLDPAVQTTDQVKQAFAAADCIVISMGDLYTSIIPNLLVEGVVDAIAESDAPVVYVCNRSTKRGETHDFTTSDFISELNRYLEPARLSVAIVDDGTVALPDDVQGIPTEVSNEAVQIITVDLADEENPVCVSGKKAAQAIYDLCESL
ncbi:MAG: gluconeogenesis factor YvcK family protein [Candidatus Kerfeldbacteria bacterium]